MQLQPNVLTPVSKCGLPVQVVLSPHIYGRSVTGGDQSTKVQCLLVLSNNVSSFQQRLFIHSLFGTPVSVHSEPPGQVWNLGSPLLLRSMHVPACNSF